MSVTRVDFAFGAPDRFRTACDVVRKHYQRQHRVIIYLDDARQLARFNTMLWGYEPTAFIPHVYADDPAAESTSIILCADAPSPQLSQAGSEAAWLLNLASGCPPNSQLFTRVLEIVSDEETDKQHARERWRQYQQLGYQLHAHKL